MPVMHAGFENVGFSTLTVFQIITMTGWEYISECPSAASGHSLQHGPTGPGAASPWAHG